MANQVSPQQAPAAKASAHVIETQVYERTPTFNRCSQQTGADWHCFNRVFRLSGEGKLEIQMRDNCGRTFWQDPATLTVAGKERFAIRQCTYRDGKVYDSAGKEVEVRTAVDESAFGNRTFALAWGADSGSLKGHRLIITKATEPPLSRSAADIGPDAAIKSPSDLPYTEPARVNHQTISICEQILVQNRCGRCHYAWRNVGMRVGYEDGKFVSVGADEKASGAFDLKRYGLRHLNFHEGHCYDAQTGKEVHLQTPLTAQQLAGKAFAECRGADGSRCLVTEGIPAGKSVDFSQLSVPETFRDARGCCYQGHVYSLHRALVDSGTETTKQYKLSDDQKTLEKFTPVPPGKDGSVETHPELGILRFTYRTNGDELIRVYEKPGTRGYEDTPSTWTIARRDDRCTLVQTNCGTQKHYKTSWVADPNLTVTTAYDEYNPPARLPSQASAEKLPDTDLWDETTDPFAQPSVKTTPKLRDDPPADEVLPADGGTTPETKTPPAKVPPEVVETRPASESKTVPDNQPTMPRVEPKAEVDTQQLALTRLPIDPAKIDPARAAELKALLQTLRDETRTALDEAVAKGTSEQDFWKDHGAAFWTRYKDIYASQDDRLTKTLADEVRRLTQTSAEPGAAAPEFAQADLVKLKEFADYYYTSAARQPHPATPKRSGWLSEAGGDHLERPVFIAVGANNTTGYKGGNTPPPADEPAHQLLKRVAAAGNSDFVLKEALSPFGRWDFSNSSFTGASYSQSSGFLEETLRLLEKLAPQSKSPDVRPEPTKTEAESNLTARAGRSRIRVPVLGDSIDRLTLPGRNAVRGNGSTLS